MEWDYSGRKGRDGQKKKIGKANERKGKVKKTKDDEVNALPDCKLDDDVDNKPLAGLGVAV